MKGKITISKTSGNRRDSIITITITDESSGTNFVIAEVGLKDFAEALTGLACVDCEYETRGLNNIGKVRETKTVNITVQIGDKTWSRSPENDAYVKILVAPYEVDGWTAFNLDRAFNPHYYTYGGTHKNRTITFEIWFVRYVEVTES